MLQSTPGGGSTDLWVGHRASDALIAWTENSIPESISCFGSWRRLDSEPSGLNEQALLLSNTVEIRSLKRAPWSSCEQGYASNLLRELVTSGDLAETPQKLLRAIIPFRSDRTLEKLAVLLNRRRRQRRKRNGGVEHDGAGDQPVIVAAIKHKMFEKMSGKSFLLELGRKIEEIPPGRVVRKRDNYQRLGADFGETYVLKAERTVSGKGVYLVSSENDHRKAVECHPGPKQVWTAWRLVDGESFNLHFLVSHDRNVTVFPLSRQIVRLNSDTRRMEYAGNHFVAPEELDDRPVTLAIELARKVAAELAQRGFRGVGGIDVIASDEKAWVVDLNPRLQGSSLLLSLGLKESIGIGLGDFHLSGFVAGKRLRSADVGVLRDVRCGNQLIVIHEGEDQNADERPDVPPGVYELAADGAKLECRGPIDLREPVRANQVFLLDPLPRGVVVESGAPIARLFFPPASTLLDQLGHERAKDLVRSLFGLPRVAPLMAAEVTRAAVDDPAGSGGWAFRLLRRRPVAGFGRSPARGAAQLPAAS